MGGARRARGRHPPGRGVAGAGRRAARPGERSDGGRVRRRPRARSGSRVAAGRSTSLPAGGLRVALVPVAAPARRGARRRHGARQDPAGARPDRARPGDRPRGRPRADRRAHQRGGELDGRGRAVHPGAPRGGADRHAAAARAGARGRGRRGRRRGHLVHALPARRPGPRTDRLVGGPLRRGPVPQEPALEGLLLRPAPHRPVQAGDHRDADGERPHGALVPALDHRPRALPEPGELPGDLREAHREGRRRAPRPPPSPDSAR